MLNILKQGRLLIFGGLGFLGLNLANYLLEQKVNFSIFDLRKDSDLEKSLRQLGINYFSGDISEYNQVAGVVKNHDLIVNLAGKSGALNSLSNPFLDLKVNLVGVLNILEAARLENTDAKIIFAGSRLQYGKVSRLPVAENHPQEPKSIYGIHKVAGERYHREYSEVFGLRSVTLRFSNPYGPHIETLFQGYNVINHFIDLALKGKTITIFGKGDQIRDFLFVDDLSQAILSALDKGESGESYNIGSSLGTKYLEAAQTIARLAQSGKVVKVPWPKDFASVETGDYIADISKAKKFLGWQPGVGFEEGVRKTINFQKTLRSKKLFSLVRSRL